MANSISLAKEKKLIEDFRAAHNEYMRNPTQWNKEKESIMFSRIIEQYDYYVQNMLQKYGNRIKECDREYAKNSIWSEIAILLRDRYDLSKNIKVTTFLTPHIIGMIRVLTKESQNIDINVYYQKKYQEIKRISETFKLYKYRYPDVIELSAIMGCKTETIQKCLAIVNQTKIELDKTDEDGNSFEVEAGVNVADEVISKINRDALLKAVERLPEIERKIIELKIANKDITLNEIHDELNIPMNRVVSTLQNAISLLGADKRIKKVFPQYSTNAYNRDRILKVEKEAGLQMTNNITTYFDSLKEAGFGHLDITKEASYGTS